MPNKSQKGEWLVWAVLLVPVLWFAAILAQSITPGIKLPALMEAVMACLEHPFALRWTDKTLPLLLTFGCIYGLCVMLYRSTAASTRQGEEHGSARWGTAAQVNARLRDKRMEYNVPLTQKVSISLDGYKHKRNTNILVIGGSGAGKTRAFTMPGLMSAAYSIKGEAACSFLVTDPKGETLRAIGPLLEAAGYDIKVLDLINFEQSDSYNPFAYLRDDKDALKLVNNLIRSTTPKESKSNDPFWERSETALVSALILYLLHEAPRSEQSFSTVMYMLENCAASEEDEEYMSPVDVLFQSLEEEYPEHIAVKQYKVFKQASGKTAKSILVTAAVRLATFNLRQVQRITDHDDMELGTLGERKRAIFCIIPDNDTTFNHIVSMLFAQAFQELFYLADYKYGGRLPVHVRFLQEEWANTQQPSDYEKILGTCRSRNISCNIVVQNLAQIKALYKDSWENLVGLCDTLLYLGGNEQSTHEYLSKALGKATINTKTHGVTKGKSGSSSENTQNAGRELLTPDEVRMLDYNTALLFVRGERPVMDHKVDLMKHPFIKLTEHGGAEPYKRTPVSYAKPDLSRPFRDLDSIKIID